MNVAGQRCQMLFTESHQKRSKLMGGWRVLILWLKLKTEWIKCFLF